MEVLVMGFSFAIVVLLGLFMANNEPERFHLSVVALVLISYFSAIAAFIWAFCSKFC